MASANYGLRVTNTIKRTVNTGSQQTAATNASTEYVRVISDTDGVHIAFGASPTATTSSTYLGANDPEIFKIDGGMKVAAIVASSTANLYIDELSE
tara:strand:- start:960 stop:1247 length:288 start_codon:yes stop_codon:yes gene_type:complete